ncbi:MAG TPA: M48 family metallopeptidase [Candidatus Xenobia bacterium]|nr:M48 family metallopeptidase [Candidatus Xenobia bacterium]
MQREARQLLSVLLAGLLAATPLLAERTRLKSGWNLFSTDKDIEFGREAAKEAEQQLPMLNDRVVDDYVNRLGQKLAAKAPGAKFPYHFKVVNQGDINAFALPGGPIYINRGTIEAAENEAQLAGVMAHEISHVALRHGTNQLTKAYVAAAPLAVLGGSLEGGGTAAQLAALGIQVGFSSVFLKFTRTAETQADLMGTQILYDTNYDTKAMADFFDVLQKRHKSRSIEFFSSHPNPDNRQQKIEAERAKLGGQENPRRDSEDFRSIRRYVASLPPPKTGTGTPAGQRQPGRPSELPSPNLKAYRHPEFIIGYPDNWKVYESGTQVAFAPAGGVSPQGMSHGVLINLVELDDPHDDLEQATNRLVRQILQQNPGMREVSHQRARVGGRAAIATQLVGNSPLKGERETDMLITVRLPDGLFYAIFVVPESDARYYNSVFSQILDSIRFR